MRNSKPETTSKLTALAWRLYLNLPLLIVCFQLAALGTACGGNAPDNAGAAASLEGGQREQSDHSIPLPPGPTEVHTRLSKLLPRPALIVESVTYGGWDADASLAFTDKEAGDGAVRKAPMPCVRGRYQSTGYERQPIPGEKSDEKMMAQTYPQVCDFYIIDTPASDAAEAVVKKIIENLERQQFEKKDPLKFTLNKDGTGPLINQYLRVDTDGDKDTAYVAYIQSIGKLVLFARETEVRKAVTGPAGERIRLPTNTQLGSRVGGQVIVLVNHALAG